MSPPTRPEWATLPRSTGEYYKRFRFEVSFCTSGGSYTAVDHVDPRVRIGLTTAPPPKRYEKVLSLLSIESDLFSDSIWLVAGHRVGMMTLEDSLNSFTHKTLEVWMHNQLGQGTIPRVYEVTYEDFVSKPFNLRSDDENAALEAVQLRGCKVRHLVADDEAVAAVARLGGNSNDCIQKFIDTLKVPRK